MKFLRCNNTVEHRTTNHLYQTYAHVYLATCTFVRIFAASGAKIAEHVFFFLDRTSGTRGKRKIYKRMGGNYNSFRGGNEQDKCGRACERYTERGEGAGAAGRRNLRRNRGDYETEFEMRLFRTGSLKERKEG